MSVPLTFVVFDLLRRDGLDLTTRPYVERRQELESLKLDGWAWTCERFDDGRARAGRQFSPPAFSSRWSIRR
jgi:bifunctional non-homologous end joining protein LigD